MRVLGLMSGTSGDGIDAALCEIEGAPPDLRVRVIGANTYPYTPDERARILAACQPETGRVDAICLLNMALGEGFAAAAERLLAEPGESADLIVSHGQTVWHAVGEDGRAQATLQLGEAAAIAERTGVTTIHNFRPRDIAAGGQGAPLIGYVDWLLLRHPEHWRAVQNIGGIANVTLLPPLSLNDVPPLVFDTGPGNAIIDGVVRLLTGGAADYDAGGERARRGSPDLAWLDALMADPYFAQLPPKSTGRERFGSEAARLLAEGRARGLYDDDVIATLTAWTAYSIADAYRRFAPAPVGEIIIGGGGAHNGAMMDMLAEYAGGVPVRTHEAVGLSSDHKEAMAFAVLGYETWHNRPGSLPAATGARHASVLGQITPGANYAMLIQKTWGV